MQERLIGYYRRAWRHRWLAVGVAWALCLPGWAGTLLWPAQYVSSTLLQAGSGAPAPAADRSSADERTELTLAALRHALSSPRAGAELAAAGAPRGDHASRIAVEVEGPDLFRVSYRAGRPELAQRSLQALMNLITSAGSPTAPGGAGATAAASGASEPTPSDSLADQLQARRAAVARLQADLAEARSLRAVRLRHLADVPRELGDARQRNPVHERAEVQLGQQEALIAALRSQLAAAQARAAELARRLPGGTDGRVAPGDGRPNGTADRPASSIGVRAIDAPAAAAGAGDSRWPEFTLRAVPSRPEQPAGAPRPAVLIGILLLSTALGAAMALWRGRLDRIVDDAPQLQERFGLPVLGTISVPVTGAERRRRQIARTNLGLACLGLLALLAGLIAAAALGHVAPLDQRLAPPGLG